MTPAADPVEGKKVLFFGSPQIAVDALRALVDSRHEVVGVVTGPDRPAGRGMQIQPSSVKAAAVESGIEVLQPDTLRSAEAQAALAGMGADLFAVVAYGLILPVEVLDTPPLGCINVHFSLLPRHRGAAPVQWAIIEGDAETGVSIMQMDPGLDTGPVLKTVIEPIGDEETAGELADRLAKIGAKALVEVVDDLENLEAVPQADRGATYAAKLTGRDAEIDWSQPAVRIKDLVRALNPRPGAWTRFNGRRLKVLRTRVVDRPSQEPPGTLTVGKVSVEVDTQSHLLELLEVQPEGKARMAAVDFFRGQHLTRGRFD
ncbi:MAG: methionyl-tRNA formyltransferase [Actinomycetota bacterium]